MKGLDKFSEVKELIESGQSVDTTNLSLSGKGLTVFPLKGYWSAFEGLRILDLSDNLISQLSLDNILINCLLIEEVDLSGNQISSVSEVCKLDNFKHLKVLNIENNPITKRHLRLPLLQLLLEYERPKIKIQQGLNYLYSAYHSTQPRVVLGEINNRKKTSKDQYRSKKLNFEKFAGQVCPERNFGNFRKLLILNGNEITVLDIYSFRKFTKVDEISANSFSNNSKDKRLKSVIQPTRSLHGPSNNVLLNSYQGRLQKKSADREEAYTKNILINKRVPTNEIEILWNAENQKLQKNSRELNPANNVHTIWHNPYKHINWRIREFLILQQKSETEGEDLQVKQPDNKPFFESGLLKKPEDLEGVKLVVGKDKIDNSQKSPINETRTSTETSQELPVRERTKLVSNYLNFDNLCSFLEPFELLASKKNSVSKTDNREEMPSSLRDKLLLSKFKGRMLKSSLISKSRNQEKKMTKENITGFEVQGNKKTKNISSSNSENCPQQLLSPRKQIKESPNQEIVKFFSTMLQFLNKEEKVIFEAIRNIHTPEFFKVVERHIHRYLDICKKVQSEGDVLAANVKLTSDKKVPVSSIQKKGITKFGKPRTRIGISVKEASHLRDHVIADCLGKKRNSSSYELVKRFAQSKLEYKREDLRVLVDMSKLTRKDRR